MKNFLLSLFMLFIWTVQTNAQAIPNPGFENWNSNSYDEPNGWGTGNAHSLSKMGVVPVTKVSGQSGYAVRIQMYIANGDTSDSYISNSLAGDPTKGEGGVPYSQQPTAITGYYRYNLPGNDSAGILVVFKKNGSIISEDFLMFRGTGDQPTFTSFSFPLSLSSTPDSVIIAAISSNLLSGVGIENGSWVEFDGLAFAGAAQAIPDGDFENWTTNVYETPIGWDVFGDSVYKSTDPYAGSYAIAMKTSLSQDSMTSPSGITTGHNSQNSGPVGGLPYTLTTDTLTGYYKYITPGADSGNVFVQLTKNGGPVGGGGYYLTPASNYTYFEVPFASFSTPDTMQINFISSSNNSPVIGSTLFVDGLALKSLLTGVTEAGSNAVKMETYPNPASDVLNIRLNHQASPVLITIYDVSGRLVKESVTIMTGLVQLNVAELSRGMYTVELRCGRESFRSMFAKE